MWSFKLKHSDIKLYLVVKVGIMFLTEVYIESLTPECLKT